MEEKLDSAFICHFLITHMESEKYENMPLFLKVGMKLPLKL